MPQVLFKVLAIIVHFGGVACEVASMEAVNMGKKLIKTANKGTDGGNKNTFYVLIALKLPRSSLRVLGPHSMVWEGCCI